MWECSPSLYLCLCVVAMLAALNWVKDKSLPSRANWLSQEGNKVFVFTWVSWYRTINLMMKVLEQVGGGTAHD